ncbi:MAG TPA: hypothetical protein VGD72_09635 [Mycobacteriales bacterium]
MIVLSLAVLAVAGVLLVVGILQGDAGTAMLAASIGTTVVAAVLLYFGVRPRGAAQGESAGAERGEAGARERPERSPALATVPAAPPVGGAATAAPVDKPAGHRAPDRARDTIPDTIPDTAPDTVPGRAPDTSATGGTPATPPGPPPVTTRAEPVLAAADAAAPPPDVPASEEDPPDEPAIERASLGDLARVASRDDEVVVVDGRPRYHLASCAHLAGRESEGLPVSEAAELGFTPCAGCTPVASLLTR